MRWSFSFNDDNLVTVGFPKTSSFYGGKVD